MFNEIMEYHDYTDMNLVNILNPWENINLETNENKVDEYKPKKEDSFKGLERVLTIIARKRLFDEYNYNQFETNSISSNGYTRSETIEIVKDELRAWCGFSDKETSFEAKDWLKYYYHNIANYPVEIDHLMNVSTHPYAEDVDKSLRLKSEIFLPSKKTEKYTLKSKTAILRSEAYLIYSWDQIVSKKSKNWECRLFYGTPKDANTFKALNYEKVIASAINLGRLNTFYLLVKNNFANELEMTKKTGTKFHPYSTVKHAEEIDILLKYIGVYLIEKRYTKKQRNIVFNKSDFSLWIDFDFAKHAGPQYMDSIGNPIITKYNPARSICAININSDYLKKYDFHIIEKAEIVDALMTSDAYSSKCQADTPEWELLPLYLQIVNEGGSSNADKYMLFSDGGFGKPLIKYSLD